jgi:hypothetical protein
VEKMNPKKEEQEKMEALLTFLEFTREGKFAKIEESSLSYIRLKEQRQEPLQEEYYYSIR